ncbi:hypothetical protein BT93_A1844 [Corymbia citriodora subsp. variegata]|nr:hypothetical protein BT93_A1844 [Corymbia citriodora subsp. variegata]
MKYLKTCVVLHIFSMMLSALQRDKHTYIYSRELNPKQRARPHRYGNYSHQRLPGLPDTWNQLFLRALFYYFFTFIMYTYWQL